MNRSAQRILDSPVGRRNPTVKLALLIVVSIALVFLLDPVTPTVIWALGVLAAVTFARIPARTLATAQLPFAAFAFGVFTVNVFSRPGEVLWQEGLLRVTAEGISIGAALAMRTLAIGVLSTVFLLSTDSVALMTSLHQHARLGARPSYAILAGYRLLEHLDRQWQLIRHAQSVRARVQRDGRPVGGWRPFVSAAFALLVVAVRHGERLSQSLESRGLGLTPRTNWRPVPLTHADAVLSIVVLGVLCAVIAAAAAAGVLQAPSSLF